MKVIANLRQGSPAWHQHRATKFNASEAPVMMGESPHATRTELLAVKKLGFGPEVDAFLQRLFDKGHAVEALLKPIAETQLDEQLHPFVALADFDERISASFDGCTFMGDITLECKLLNERLRAAFVAMQALAPNLRERHAAQFLPIDYRIQMEQQLRVSGAQRCLFMSGELRDDGTLGDVFSCWYYADDALWSRIYAGWEMFAQDLQTYVPREAPPPAPVATVIQALPAVLVTVEGKVLTSNLKAFEQHASKFIAAIKTDLSTDQDFADAEAQVKFCEDAEKRLALAKEQTLSQAASINEVFATIDRIREQLKAKRLALDKTVTARKATIRTQMVTEFQELLWKHHAELNALAGGYLPQASSANFAAAIKGKRTITSLREACQQELVNAKIELANQHAVIVRNLELLREHAAQYRQLFPREVVAVLVAKPCDDCLTHIRSRINEHEQAEAQRLAAERERIEREVRAQAEREAREAEARLAAQERERLQAIERQTLVAASRTMGLLAEARRVEAFSPELQDAMETMTSDIAADTVINLAASKVTPLYVEPTLNISTITKRLGFALTAQYIETLGIKPAKRHRTTTLYHETDFRRICQALKFHLDQKMNTDWSDQQAA